MIEVGRQLYFGCGKNRSRPRPGRPDALLSRAWRRATGWLVADGRRTGRAFRLLHSAYSNAIPAQAVSPDLISSAAYVPHRKPALRPGDQTPSRGGGAFASSGPRSSRPAGGCLGWGAQVDSAAPSSTGGLLRASALAPSTDLPYPCFLVAKLGFTVGARQEEKERWKHSDGSPDR